jgi:amino acid adenylation domain-containing protein
VSANPRLVQDLLWEAERTAPTAIAVRDRDGAWTYEQLAAHARRLAAWLRVQGVTPGDRVVVEAVAERRFTAAVCGCLAAGAVVVPLNPNLKPYQRDHVLKDSASALVVVRHPETTQPAGATVVGFEALPLDGAPVGGDRVPERSGSPADTAMLLYTSGSTAMPKAVECPHAQIVFAVGATQQRLGYRSDDVVYSRLPLSFDYGLYQLFLCMTANAELALAPADADAGLVADLVRVGATVVPLVPSLATVLVRLAQRRPARSRVRLFTNTGEHLPEQSIAELRRHFPDAGIQLMYGTTECKRISIMEVDGDRIRPGSVGRPLTGTDVWVVDRDGQPVPPFETGEIVVAGPHVMAGYWRSPDGTARTFRQDPESGRVLLHTGDRGYADEDGYLYFVGRDDDLYKSQGVRTSTTEVEAAAYDVPGVREAAVLTPTPERGAVLCVVSGLAPHEILAQLDQRLESLKVPRICEVFDEFPYGPNGKIDRERLATLVRA